jgi:transcriptional regulator with XRE-family HTH domain
MKMKQDDRKASKSAAVPPAGAKRRSPKGSPARNPALADLLREARKNKDLSLQDVADATGLSIGLISQIERGLTTPSMRSLRQIADAVDVSVSSLFARTDAEDAGEARNITRKDMRRVLNLESIGMHMEIMTPPEGTPIQAFVAYLLPGGMSGTEFDSHIGHEFGIIIDGQLELFLGPQRYLLNPGDTFSFNSETPHRYVNSGTTMTYIHWVITPPIY